MKKYKVNVNGTVYEVTVEAMDGAAPVAADAQRLRHERCELSTSGRRRPPPCPVPSWTCASATARP